MTMIVAMAVERFFFNKIFFSRTKRLMIWELRMKHQGEELYKVYVNIDLRDRKQYKSCHGFSMHVIGAKDQNKNCVRFF